MVKGMDYPNHRLPEHVTATYGGGDDTDVEC